MDQKQLYEQQVAEAQFRPQPDFLGQRESCLLRWIADHCEKTLNQPGAHIAELSVGDGQLSRALMSSFPIASIDCTDISSTRLEQCRQAVAGSPSLSQRMQFLELNLDTDFDQLPTASYDAVVAIDILEHVFDPFRFVRSCRELIKPDGVLFLRVPNLAYVKRRIAILTGKLPVTSSYFETPGSYRAWKDRHGWDGGHLHFFTIGSLRWLLEAEGLRCESWDDVGSTAEAVRRIWPGMLFGNLAVVTRKKDQPNASAY